MFHLFIPIHNPDLWQLLIFVLSLQFCFFLLLSNIIWYGCITLCLKVILFASSF